MKNIIIHTTNDEVVSLKLVDKIVSAKEFKDYNFDIFINESGYLRKLKILLVFFLFGSIKSLLKESKKRISLNSILSNYKNCKIINKIEGDYNFGLNVYGISKIKLQKYKIYNFHLGSLYNQRGSFIFFYKFIYNWQSVDLTFHEVNNKYDVGKIYNKRTINLDKKTSATDICFLYLDNLDFLKESILKLRDNNFDEYKEYDKINSVPSFVKLLSLMINYFYKKFLSPLSND
tara:strand:+ start:2054 stop:2749 length:696 start_codon:yes stop_codon:yes gene_type:complete